MKLEVMSKFFHCIEKLIENITVSDRQEESIKKSLLNIESCLLDEESDLNVNRVFTNGSYERDTIIRPLDDIDLFAVLRKDDCVDEFGNLPSPQSILTRFKNYFDSIPAYSGKVHQSRPCVTIKLSDKDFDVLPSIEIYSGGYFIPGPDLKSWIVSYPEKLTNELNSCHENSGYRVKQIVKVIKYWNRLNSNLIPSFHIEEIAINIFNSNPVRSFEEGVRMWFTYSRNFLQMGKIGSETQYFSILKALDEVRGKLEEAFHRFNEGNDSLAILIWKELFQREFPTIDIDEARSFAKALTEGSLKVGISGSLSTNEGKPVSPSKGFYGDIYEN